MIVKNKKTEKISAFFNIFDLKNYSTINLVFNSPVLRI
jgi:hypothetical protein